MRIERNVELEKKTIVKQSNKNYMQYNQNKIKNNKMKLGEIK